MNGLPHPLFNQVSTASNLIELPDGSSSSFPQKITLQEFCRDYVRMSESYTQENWRSKKAVYLGYGIRPRIQDGRVVYDNSPYLGGTTMPQQRLSGTYSHILQL